MQFLANLSMEKGEHSGLGIINGAVKMISPNDSKFRIPHIGWNNVMVRKRTPLFVDLENEPVFYFVNSYHFEPEDGEVDKISSTCWHGTLITASIQKENIFGVQFHPEKSQETGLKLLENFIKVIGERSFA